MANIKILQFGEGVFLRGFLAPLIEECNLRASDTYEIYMVKPRAGVPNPAFKEQNCQYHLLKRGFSRGEVVEELSPITVVKELYSAIDDFDKLLTLICDPELRLVVSNTTEAGIVHIPGNCNTFAGVMARLLQKRASAGLEGVTFLPCELIEQNASLLREAILAYLVDDPASSAYVSEKCRFCETLVDRIVSGFPADGGNYAPHDKLLVASEPFSFWAIQGDKQLFEFLPLNEEVVVFASDISPYRLRKVRCLNASHAAMVMAGLLANFEFVAELLDDPSFRQRIEETLFNEILPTLSLPDELKLAYAASVLERFANPFVKHRLQAIALNSIAKWRVRILPIIRDYYTLYQALPKYLTQSCAELIRYYQTQQANDDPEICAFFAVKPDLNAILARRDWWSDDFYIIPELKNQVLELLKN